MKVDISKLNYKELIELEKEVQKLIEIKREDEKKQFINTVKELSSQSGFDLEDIFDSVYKAKNKKTKKAVEIKYKGPNGETWSGRGRQPVWIKTALENGKILEDFEVK